MTEYNVHGITVKFPFVPYRPQEEYMKKMIECLNDGRNAILESPTGTGKTLSLLCAAMAWIESQKEGGSQQQNFVRNGLFDESDDSNGNIPTVIYATRTHSQILQAMRELRKTEYKKFKAAMIGSRNQLCLNPALQKKSNSDKIYMCKELVKERTCEYNNNVEMGMRLPELKENIVDIEELASIGRKHTCCPYYMTKKKAERADIIFLPYAYLIDPTVREANDIELADSIVILDEAHNVGQVCEQSASAKIELPDISAALRDINYIINDLCNSANDVQELRRSIQNFKTALEEIEADTYPGRCIFELLRNANLTHSNHDKTLELLEKLITALVYRRNSTHVVRNEQTENHRLNNNPPHPIGAGGAGLKAMVTFLQTVFSCKTEDIDRHFKVHVECKPKPINRNQRPAQNSSENTNDGEIIKILHFWCFTPAVRMKSLLEENIRCLILTSSTLAPFASLLAEMKIQAPHQLINRHIINRRQVFARILSTGIDQQSLDSSYTNRENESYLSSVGKSIVEIAKVVPDGLLVFFPSYDLMTHFIELWKNSEIWQEIEEQKQIFTEPKTKDEFHQQIKNYYSTVRENGGAIFMAVLRAKISEGIDFSDIYGRAVVIVGIPFAPARDRRIELKKEYLNERLTHGDGSMSGEVWYALDAIRATNQAIGRVIRHKNDYGAIFLCDFRFNKSQQKSSLPAWIQNHLNRQRATSFRDIMQEASQFFEEAEEVLPTPRDLPTNLESFVLFEDDVDMEALELSPEPYPIDNENNLSPDANRSHDSNEEQREENTRIRSTSNQNDRNNLAGPSTSRAGAQRSTSSDEEVIVRSKRIKRKINTIESDSNDDSQDDEDNPFWNILKGNVGAATFTKLKKFFSDYLNDNDYEKFRQFFVLFNDNPHPLQDMILFIKVEHRLKFLEDSKAYAESHQ